MMMHPSYREMIKAVNQESEDDTTPVVSSRYSIVMATAHRARQIVDGDAPLVGKVKAGSLFLLQLMRFIREK